MNKVLNFMIITVILMLLIGSLCLQVEASGTSGQASDDWPMYRHDPQRTGVSTSTVPNTNETRWIYNATSEFDSSPAVADGKLIVGQSNGDILALNLTTGKLIWHYATDAGDNSIWSSPAIDSGRVYIGTRNSNLYCLNESTGGLLWIQQVGGSIDSSPVVSNGRLYFGADDGKLHCLNSTTGSAIWTYDTLAMFSSPAIVDDVVYVTSSYSPNMYALNATTGSVIWQVTVSGTDSSPLVKDGKMYFGGNGIYCLNATTGLSIWNSTNVPGGHNFFVIRSSPAILNDKLYIGSEDGMLYCLNANTGAILWSYQTAGTIWGSPAVADGKVLIGNGYNKILCLDANTGGLIWSYLTGYRSLSGPVVCGGIVYAGAGGAGLTTPSAGSIYAFGPTNLSPTNLTLTLNSETAYLGFKVTLNGALSYLGNSTTIAGVPIELAYSINNGQTWNDITSVTTGSDGSYSAVWAPSATGTFLVRARFAENYPYARSEADRTLSVTLYNNQYVFSVESNSTVTSLAYNSISNQLSFTVSGESGTKGYVRATIAKSLVGDIANLAVTLDGANLQYQVTSTADSWTVQFNYSHSTHSVGIQLGNLPASPTTTPTPTQTAAPTATPTANPTDKPTATPTISPSPTAPEFPTWILVFLPAAALAALAVVKSGQKRKQNNS